MTDFFEVTFANVKVRPPHTYSSDKSFKLKSDKKSIPIETSALDDQKQKKARKFLLVKSQRGENHHDLTSYHRYCKGQ